jgi:putative transposase
MTDPTIALKQYLINDGLDGNTDFLREAVQLLSQMLIELEAEQEIGAAKHERTKSRTNHRNGYRKRTWETRVGEIDLAIPKLRRGSFFPGLLEPRKRSEKALLAVVQEAYINGVSTRKVDALVKALGLTGIDKSRVSRICKELDEMVEQFRHRSLQAHYPYLWLDAIALKVRQNHRVVNLALVIAIGVDEQGERHLLGFELGAGESGAFWLDFLRSLKRRGLKRVQLVISDAHEGLKAAIDQALTGAAWQRCRVHFMRNMLSQVAYKDKKQVAEAVKLVFAQPDRDTAGSYLRRLAEAMQARWSRAADMLLEAEEDILVYKTFPEKHHRSIHSTNPLERLNREIRRRTRVVGVFPNRPSLFRLVGTLLLETDEEWRARRCYFGQESMHELLNPDLADDNTPAPILLKPMIELEAQTKLHH